jgi:hypothetical protein
MVITFPADALPIALADPDRAAARIASVIVGLKPDAYRADAETQARQIVDEATRTDAFLLAIVAPPGADPAVLTGMPVAAPPAWTQQVADRLRWSLADVAGDAATVHTAVGPAVLVERPRQLQAFLPDDDTAMLLLTLSTVSARGWAAQRELFVGMVASATRDEPN